MTLDIAQKKKTFLCHRNDPRKENMVFKNMWSLLVEDPSQYELNQLNLILCPLYYTFILFIETY
jgi:hypothetical protein